MPVYRLNKGEITFPNPMYARRDGLLAVGGDLSVERLLLAYTIRDSVVVPQGAFRHIPGGDTYFPFHAEILEETQAPSDAEQGFRGYYAPLPHSEGV